MAGFKESVNPAVFDGTNLLNDPTPRPKTGVSKFSVGCWFKLDSSAGTEYIISGDGIGKNSWHIRKQADQKVYCVVRNDANQAQDIVYNEPSDTEVNFVVMNVDSESTIDIYMNGEKVVSDVFNLSLPFANQNTGICIGSRRPVLDTPLFGLVWGAFEIYDSILTPDQVKTLYGQGVGIPAKLLKTYGLDSGLIAGYDLHGENPLVDLSGNGNHLANVNNVTFDGDAVDVVYQPFQTVVGAEFDGTNYLVSANAPIDQEYDKASIGAFVNFSDYSRTTDFFSVNDWMTLGIRNNTVTIFLRTVINNYISHTEAISSTGVVHICATWDGTLASNQSKIYLNGALLGSKSFSQSALRTSSKQIAIGGNPTGTNTALGSIYNGFIVTTALTPEDIKALYNRGVGVDLKKLPSRLKDSAVGLYPLDDLLDYSGNGNDLTNVNNVALTATKQGQRLLDKPPTELVLTGNMAYMPASSSSTIELATADRYTAEGTEWTASCFIDTLSPLAWRSGVLTFRANNSYYVKIYSTGDLLINLPAPVGLITINMSASEYDGVNHLCITSGAEGLQVYWSGSLIYSDPAGAVEMPSPTSTFYTNWGRGGSTTNDRMSGSLASCAFFLSEASAEDVEDLANNIAYESLRTDFKATCKEFITLTENVPSTGLQHTNLVTGNVVDKAQHSGFTAPTIDYKIKL